MKTGLGVEMPRRVQVVGATALAFVVIGAVVGGVTTSGRISVDFGAPITAGLMLLGVVLIVVTVRLGAEMRRTSAVEFERQGYTRGEVAASWRLHWLQIGIATAIVVYSALVLLVGDGHWVNALIMVCSLVTLVVYTRSAYLRRRREQRQRAGTVDGEVSR